MVRKSLAVVALAAAACVASCSSASKPSGTSGGDAGGDDGGTGPASYTVTFGPIQVPPSTENTQCIVVRLGNAAAIHVGQIHDLLGNSSHHMILYKVADTTEQPTPFDCKPFTDTLNPAKGNPLIISQKKDDTLTLPKGVAFTLDANQMVRLEMHYINASATQTVTLQTTSTLTPLVEADYQYDASFLFVGDLDVSIPPMSSATLGPIFFPVPSQYASANFFAMTGHEHQWGTKVQIWTAQSATDPGTLKYTNTSWSDPVTTQFDPPMQMAAGSGFKYQCDWYNASSNTVMFGESATAEMCFFWAYYYPSQGASVCFHSDKLGGGFDACCPGSSLCSSLGN
jgi:hypothetical protein